MHEHMSDGEMQAEIDRLHNAVWELEAELAGRRPPPQISAETASLIGGVMRSLYGPASCSMPQTLADLFDN